MRLRVGAVRKLARQKNIGSGRRKLFRHTNTAQKSTLLGTDESDLGTVTANQFLALATHPVGHEDRDRMSQRATNGSKRDAGVAAGSFCNRVARSNPPRSISLLQDMQCHPVLDAAGQLQLFRLGINSPVTRPIFEVDAKEWRVPNQTIRVLKSLR